MAGVINKIRSKGAIVVTVVGIALASFVLSDLLQNIYKVYQGDDTPDVLAKIGGKRIKADEFKNRVDEQEYMQQLNGGPQQMDRDQIAGQVWDQVVNESIFDKEFEKLGLKVTDAEFKDMLFGKDPDPTAISIFQNPENMRTVLQQSEKDPNMKFRLHMAERYLVRNRLTTKYNTLIKNGLFVSKAEARRKMEEERKTAKFEYVAVSYSALADKDFKPTDADYNEVYNEYKEEFRQKTPEVVLNYVAIPKSATKRDTMMAYDYLNGIASDFRKTQDDSAFAASRNRSGQRFDFEYKNRSEFDPNESELLANAKKDSVYGPVLSGKVLKIIKVNNIQKNDTAPFVKIRHILLQPQGDTTQAYIDFQTLKATVTKDNFAMKVMEKSDDQRSKMSGGELGWYRWGSFGQNTELDKALKKAGKGQIFGAKSAAGYHIVEVQDRSTEGIRLATIGFDVEPGKETTDSLLTIAQRLRLEANNDTAKFNKLAKDRKLVVKNSQPIAPGAAYLDGLAGGTVKGLIGWALMKDAGDFFDRTYDSDNMILVGYIASKVTEGYKPMAMVKNQLKDRVMARLKAKKIKEKLATASKGKTDLAQIQTAYGAGAFTNTAEGVSFSSGYISGVGQDPILIGKAFRLKPNQISAPIVAKTGVYVVKLVELTEMPKQDDKALEEYRISLQQNRRTTFIGKVQQGLRDYADVKDYRYKHGY